MYKNAEHFNTRKDGIIYHLIKRFKNRNYKKFFFNLNQQ